jgi:tetratricopeptide (TPR) repeat protein
MAVDNDIEALLSQAHACWSTGDARTALSLLQGSAHAQAAVVLFAMAPLHAALGDQAAAKTCLDQAIEQEPHVAAFFVSRSTLLLASEDFDEALEDARAAVALDANDPHAQATLAAVLERTGDALAAARAYEAVHALTGARAMKEAADRVRATLVRGGTPRR